MLHIPNFKFTKISNILVKSMCVPYFHSPIVQGFPSNNLNEDGKMPFFYSDSISFPVNHFFSFCEAGLISCAYTAFP